MYEWDWQTRGEWKPLPVAEFAESRLPRRDVARTSLLHWQEHCVECAEPLCFKTCPLYVPRADGKCRRFVHGIVPDERFGGLLNHGADLHFRRWGKLEAWLSGRSVPVGLHRRLGHLDRGVSAAVGAVSATAEPAAARRFLSRGLASLRRRGLARATRTVPADRYDAFVVECYSPLAQAFRLMVEVSNAERTLFRTALPIQPGHNFHQLPTAGMNLGEDLSGTKISIYPENDAEVRLIFTWLDFVVFRDAGRRSAASPAAPAPAAARAATGAAAPAAKVKCVAWDLDNTLWRGTLVESAPEELELDPHAAELVRQLDERGILQTIVSKNNHDDAWAVINKHGLADYFLFPAINWGQKSLNLKQVAEQLNINIDTFAMIDDSDFERAEIAAALPQVRVYPETAIGTLLRRPEFDVTVTELSRQRRLTYLNNIQRDRARETFAGDYEEFLRSCEMRLRLFVPERRGDVERCLELIQRSNQLNLSSRRYAAAEFEALLAREGVLCVALHCADRFGDYGIVGFSSVDEARDEPLILDFVLSCRVAQKRVEHSYFQWLADRQALRGRRRLRAMFTRTAKNAALFRVFEETPFERVAERDGEQHLELDLARRVVERPVMRVEADIPERLKAAS